MALVAASSWWFRAFHVPADREREIAIWRDRLSATAEDRRFALDHWLASGVGDARTIARFPTVGYLLGSGVSRSQPFPRELGAKGHLRELLQGALDEQGYRRAALVSSAESVVEAVGVGDAQHEAGAVVAARQAIREGSASVHVWRHTDGTLGVLFAAPGPAHENGGGVPGAIVLDADPESFLFPLLRAGPTATRSGETMLALREGNQALFVAPGRHGSEGPLERRQPIDEPRFAMRLALDGEETFGEFLDYDGHLVFAATRRLRTVPWGLVSKVDVAEALSVHERRTRAQGNTGALLLLAVIGLGGALLRWRSAAHEARLNASRARVALLLDQANDAILFVGADGLIREANRRADELYGVSGGRHIFELRAEEDRPAAQGQFAQALAGGVRFETVHLRADGSRIPVEVSSRAVELDGETTVVSVVRDVSERKQAEARLRRLNRLYRTLSDVNLLIVRGADRDALFEGV